MSRQAELRNVDNINLVNIFLAQLVGKQLAREEGGKRYFTNLLV